jgi:glucose-1-phosphate cytidylyltransferase
MKVVLFCGGLGTRLRENAGTIPKPLVNVGARPIIWHLMRYYAHFGHKDFVLCLGYQGSMIRDYFLTYNECYSNDFTLSEGGRKIEMHSTDIQDWRITFVETGLHATIGERLLKARRYVEGERAFLANYADGLADLPLNLMIEDFESKNVVASLAAVSGGLSFHTIDATSDGFATRIKDWSDNELLINGGYFVFRRDVFDYIEPGDDLVGRPFARLMERQQLAVFRHGGFWRAMDTFKDKITLDRMAARGDCPWMVWEQGLGTRAITED